MKKREPKSKTKLTYTSEEDPILRKLLINSIEFLTGRRKLEKLYNQALLEKATNANVFKLLLKKLEIDLDINLSQLANVPKKGPVVFIANHPFGVVDGIIFCDLVSQVRAKFSILVNAVLCTEEILKDHLLPIDFEDSKSALKTNIETRNTAIDRLQKGEAIAIFPSGAVASSDHLLKKEAKDWEWKNFVLKLIQKTGATVVPIYFHGQNSRSFQIASNIHPNLRLALLLNEVRNKMKKRLAVRIGKPIMASDILYIKDRKVMLEYLRNKTFDLAKDL